MTADEIRAFRLARGWRQRDLAEFLGIDQPAVSEYERGMRALPPELAALLGEAPPAPEEVEPAAASAPPPGVGDGAGGAGGDVPPRAVPPPSGDDPPTPAPTRTRTRKSSTVVVQRDLAELEARVLKLVIGDDLAIAIAEPGSSEVRWETAHVPGVADIVAAVNPFDGEIIRANGVAMTKAWVNLARENERVRRILEALTAGGAWRGVITATAPVVLAILLNHGLLPSLPGFSVVGRPGEYDARRDGGIAGAGGDAPGWRETATGSVG